MIGSLTIGPAAWRISTPIAKTGTRRSTKVAEISATRVRIVDWAEGAPDESPRGDPDQQHHQ
jgi:hypothetical protein